MGTWQDPSLTEASWLTYSNKFAALAYVGNDEAGQFFIVDLSTGKTVGKIGISGATLVDPESSDMDPNGVWWVADTGDNDENRSSIDVYYRREPGPGYHGNVDWVRINLEYPGGASHNAETFIIWPNGKKQIVDKRASGSVFQLPTTLVRGEVNTMKLVHGPDSDLAFLSDAVASKDGKWAFAVRKDELDNVAVYDSKWNLVDFISMPAMVKPEGIGIKKDGKGLWVCDDKGGTGGKFQQVKIPKAYWPVKKPVTPPPPNTPPANPCAA